MYSTGGVAANKSGLANVLISFATIRHRYCGSFSSFFFPVNPSDLDRFLSRLRQALGSRDLRPNFHAADFLDLFPSCFFHQVRSQLLPVSIIPVLQLVMILGVLLNVVDGD